MVFEWLWWEIKTRQQSVNWLTSKTLFFLIDEGKTHFGCWICEKKNTKFDCNNLSLNCRISENEFGYFTLQWNFVEVKISVEVKEKDPRMTWKRFLIDSNIISIEFYFHFFSFALSINWPISGNYFFSHVINCLLQPNVVNFHIAACR